eukprot:m.12023 g.12023  ORF g.12023 m.12023 type:complete len:335 (-) comp4572_c0_seq1:136-1140(-)
MASDKCMRIGIIGGSGLYQMDSVEVTGQASVITPFGSPSGKYVIGRLKGENGKLVEGCELVFLPRHGVGHKYSPTEVNYRANVFGMKKLGVNWIISVSAVGSLRKEIDKGHVVLIDQFIDKTRHRKDTFFEKGVVGHAPFGDPVCPTLRSYLLDSCKEIGCTFHEKGTYVNMEGPAFSTRAESELHRSWGASVIGMTTLTEARLCREAEISYAVLAMATDYDCWNTEEEHVTVDVVIETLKKNVNTAKKIIAACVPRIMAHKGQHPSDGIMSGAIMTDPKLIPENKKRALAPIIGKYIKAQQKEASSGGVGITSFLLFAGGILALMAVSKSARN